MRFKWDFSFVFRNEVKNDAYILECVLYSKNVISKGHRAYILYENKFMVLW